MTYHQTEYDDLLELVRKLPDKAQLLLRQGCRHAERSSLINEPEAEVFGPALLERPFDFYGRPSPGKTHRPVTPSRRALPAFFRTSGR